MDDIKNELELPEGTLVTNLFIPSAVICSKVDLIHHGSDDVKNQLERNLDFIQSTLRKFCLSYGSGLFFCSSNQNSNIEIIYEYILTKLYNNEFMRKSNTTDKEALFIPSGLDSIELIDSVFNKNLFFNKHKDLQDKGVTLDLLEYTDIVRKP
jgi:dynein light intermediate chain 1